MSKEAARAKLQEKLQEKMNEENTEKAEKKPKRPTYRDNVLKGKLITLDEAKKRRWARKSDGQPTKLWELRVAKMKAEQAGEPEPIRTWNAKNPDQEFNGLKSPYDLNRRSGQRLIWQVLAENLGNVLTREQLQDEVVAKYKAEFPEYYAKKYTDEAPFDTWTTAVVMNRAPFNAKIEALQQRVEVDTVKETITLLTDVSEPRQPKKRGRRPKAVEETPTVEADNDNVAEVEVEAAVEETAEATA
jgi:hypothetical protein